MAFMVFLIVKILKDVLGNLNALVEAIYLVEVIVAESVDHFLAEAFV